MLWSYGKRGPDSEFMSFDSLGCRLRITIATLLINVTAP